MERDTCVVFVFSVLPSFCQSYLVSVALALPSLYPSTFLGNVFHTILCILPCTIIQKCAMLGLAHYFELACAHTYVDLHIHALSLPVHSVLVL